MLPPVEPEDVEPAGAASFHRPNCTAVGFYWSLIDPLAGVETGEPPQPGLGDLDDDLGDIAADLARGLGYWRLGDECSARRAVWEWRFRFYAHWGAHATGALGVLVGLGE